MQIFDSDFRNMQISGFYFQNIHFQKSAAYAAASSLASPVPLSLKKEDHAVTAWSRYRHRYG